MKNGDGSGNDREITAVKRDWLHFEGDWLHFGNFNKKSADICNKPIKKLG
ncbi:MAG: hypothetical protein J6C33_12640 [Lachnospiraceae bacterium]|nr:hypothetical protein [Lachnospiraceae bacterium]